MIQEFKALSFIQFRSLTKYVFWISEIIFIKWCNKQNAIILNCACALFVSGCVYCSKQETVEQCLWGKQRHIKIHSTRNLETTCCTSWYWCRKVYFEDFTVFGCQSEASAQDSEKKIRRYGNSETSLSVQIRKDFLNFLSDPSPDQ